MLREVTVQFLQNCDKLYKDMPQFDRQKNARETYRVMGLDSDMFFLDPSGPMSPRKEFEAIMAGDRPKVQPGEDSLNVHMPMHQAQAQILQTILQQAQMKHEDTQAIEGWMKVLGAHLLETNDNAMLQMQMMQQQAMAQAQQQPPPGKGNGQEKGGKQPLKPPQGHQIANGIRSSAGRPPSSGAPQ
jgi:hypothetical protein